MPDWMKDLYVMAIRNGIPVSNIIIIYSTVDDNLSFAAYNDAHTKVKLSSTRHPFVSTSVQGFIDDAKMD